MVSIAHWRITIPGEDNCIDFCAIGEAEGIDVYLDIESINFGEIKVGNTKSRLLKLHNESELEAKYQFFNDQNNIFGISSVVGTVKPKSHVRIIVSFNPNSTICYYERVYCAVLNHKIIYVDLLGTCYDLLFKPLPIV